MPTYDYTCDACGHSFELFQSMKDQPIKKCPKCGKNKARRLIGTGAGLIFKGSGFYITDYRDAGYADKAKAESGAAGGKSETTAGGDAPKTDAAKPAAAEPAKPAAASAKPAASSTEAKPASKPAAPSKKAK